MQIFKIQNFHFGFAQEAYLINLICQVRRNILKENFYDFSIDCDAIDKSKILNILKYIMIKDNLK